MIWTFVPLTVLFDSGLSLLRKPWFDGFFTGTRTNAFPEYSEMRLVGFRYKHYGETKEVELIKPVKVGRDKTMDVGRFDLPESRISIFGTRVNDSRAGSFGVRIHAEAGKPLRFDPIYFNTAVTDLELIVEYK